MTEQHETRRDEYLSIDEAAERAGISVRTLHRKLAAGEVRSFHIFGKGRRHFFTQQEVYSWLTEQAS